MQVAVNFISASRQRKQFTKFSVSDEQTDDDDDEEGRKAFMRDTWMVKRNIINPLTSFFS